MGWTAREYALEYGYKKIAKYLKKHEAQ